MADNQNTVYVATRSFTATVDGDTIDVVAGSTEVRSGHPLLDQHSDSFREAGKARDVEQATAAPGEKRA